MMVDYVILLAKKALSEMALSVGKNVNQECSIAQHFAQALQMDALILSKQ